MGRHAAAVVSEFPALIAAANSCFGHAIAGCWASLHSAQPTALFRQQAHGEWVADQIGALGQMPYRPDSRALLS
jgi:hypothetical protein